MDFILYHIFRTIWNKPSKSTKYLLINNLPRDIPTYSNWVLTWTFDIQNCVETAGKKKNQWQNWWEYTITGNYCSDIVQYIDNDQHQHDWSILQTFVPINSFGWLLNTSPTKYICQKTFHLEFSVIEVCWLNLVICASTGWRHNKLDFVY